MEYVKPRDEAELLVHLQRDGAAIVCGATDVLVKMRRGMRPPEVIVDIADLRELHGVSKSAERLVVGAATTEEALLGDTTVRLHFPLLTRVLASLASPQVRSRGTLGGNVANASPAADSAIPLLVYEASVCIVGTEGRRELPIDKFFLGPGRTALTKGEFIHSFALPLPQVPWNVFYHKVGQRQGLVISVASLGMLIRCGHGVIQGVRLAAGSVAPTPLRLRAVESLLTNQKLSDSLAAEAGKLAASAVCPIGDIRASAAYRRQVIEDLLRQFLASASESCAGL